MTLCVTLWLINTCSAPPPAIENTNPQVCPPCLSWGFPLSFLFFFLPQCLPYLCWWKWVWRTCTDWSSASGLFVLIFFFSSGMFLLGHCKETLFHLVCWRLVVADCFLPPLEWVHRIASSKPRILAPAYLTSDCRALISQLLQRLLPCAKVVNWGSILGVYLNAEHLSETTYPWKYFLFLAVLFACSYFINTALL